MDNDFDEEEQIRLEYAELDYQLYKIKHRIAELKTECEQYWSTKNNGEHNGNGN